MLGMEELVGAELHPDPVVLELNRLQNHLKEKDRELGNAQGEIKALRATEVLKDKAIEELTSGFEKLEEKLRFNENLLEQKNLEIKKLASEKREAIAAQYAAEATLRRVHANQKDDDSLPIETVVAPLEAEIKMYKIEITALQEDIKALERLSKSKEVALLEAEKILRSALERALIVEEVQNHNFELKRQIEICQEENRILDKTHRQKVLEVEKLTETIKELEEAILAGGAAANAIRDYQRQISELHDEKRTLERELARIKVSANRVATVVANEWKDENDKVMPVKQWLEERRLLQAEMQRLREKLVISERTAKAEAQLKEKLKLRLKTVEEGLKHVTSFAGNTNTFCGSPKPEKSTHIFGFLSTSNGQKKRSTSQPRASTIGRINPLQKPSLEQANSFKKKGLWVSRVKVVDSGEKENKEINKNSSLSVEKFKDRDISVSGDIRAKIEEKEETMNREGHSDDLVSGFLYDRLQKEVIALRKHCEAKDNTVNAKDEEIKMLTKKVDTLIKAIEVESKKTKREAATKEKEAGSAKADDNRKTRSTSTTRRVVKAC